MVVNFRACGISRGAAQADTHVKLKKKDEECGND